MVIYIDSYNDLLGCVQSKPISHKLMNISLALSGQMSAGEYLAPCGLIMDLIKSATRQLHHQLMYTPADLVALIRRFPDHESGKRDAEFARASGPGVYHVTRIDIMKWPPLPKSCKECKISRSQPY